MSTINNKRVESQANKSVSVFGIMISIMAIVAAYEIIMSHLLQ